VNQGSGGLQINKKLVTKKKIYIKNKGANENTNSIRENGKGRRK
jgi:hypothetical protein